jgi:hypothetical protein
MTKRAIESTVFAAALSLVACRGSSQQPHDGGSPVLPDGGPAATLDGGPPPSLDGGPLPSLDGSLPPPVDADAVLAAGTHRLSFSIDSSSAALPVVGLDLTVQLPDGVQVAAAADGTGAIPRTALSAGSAVGTRNLMVGRYLAAVRQVRVSLTAPAKTAWSGEFARLTITIPAGTTIGAAELMKTVAGQFPAYRAVGLSTSARATVDLSSAVKAAVALLD